MDFDEFILKQTEWRGVVTAKLENMSNNIDTLKSDFKEHREHLESELKEIRKANTQRDIRVAGIAGGISAIMWVAGFLISNAMG